MIIAYGVALVFTYLALTNFGRRKRVIMAWFIKKEEYSQPLFIETQQHIRPWNFLSFGLILFVYRGQRDN